ncbi:hypothetical protein C0R09_14530 [Brevibacillus laterosporus]|uniref:hypothetical protein n=1 Tax=Brevibacillus laterosporus TaxID=1465 RepID=UPI000C75ADCE|nr:hypothetical protein [Brevibacillus laterosporus]AUM65639.1 hypothetical protein C0R09_14530 [Brevibacillus laterosporus]
MASITVDRGADVNGFIKAIEDRLNKEIKKSECEFEQKSKEMQERMNRVREKMGNWEPRLIRKR